MKYLALLLLTLTLGCDAAPSEYTAQGTVLNVWCRGTSISGDPICDINFEHDNGKLQRLTFIGMPAVWKGLHCKILYRDRDGFSFMEYAVRK